NAARHPDMHFEAADLARESPGLPFAPEMGLSCEVIEHVDDPAAFLAHVRASLAEGGSLFLSTQSGKIRPTEVSVGHMCHFTAPELAGLLEEAGFSEVRVWNEGFPFHDLSKALANVNPQATMARFSGSDYGPAERVTSLALRLLFLFNSRTRGAQLYGTARKGPE
ncbi:MAG: class I SAM-dependent methyltransferase, partial [Proteobacteria bacterium]|nr:class I SAM-dependent methyltransferase [Pseudomonadota bacterium]